MSIASAMRAKPGCKPLVLTIGPEGNVREVEQVLGAQNAPICCLRAPTL